MTNQTNEGQEGSNKLSAKEKKAKRMAALRLRAKYMWAGSIFFLGMLVITIIILSLMIAIEGKKSDKDLHVFLRHDGVLQADGTCHCNCDLNETIRANEEIRKEVERLMVDVTHYPPRLYSSSTIRRKEEPTITVTKGSQGLNESNGMPTNFENLEESQGRTTRETSQVVAGGFRKTGAVFEDISDTVRGLADSLPGQAGAAMSIVADLGDMTAKLLNTASLLYEVLSHEAEPGCVQCRKCFVFERCNVQNTECTPNVQCLTTKYPDDCHRSFGKLPEDDGKFNIPGTCCKKDYGRDARTRAHLYDCETIENDPIYNPEHGQKHLKEKAEHAIKIQQAEERIQILRKIEKGQEEWCACPNECIPDQVEENTGERASLKDRLKGAKGKVDKAKEKAKSKVDVVMKSQSKRFWGGKCIVQGVESDVLCLPMVSACHKGGKNCLEYIITTYYFNIFSLVCRPKAWFFIAVFVVLALLLAGLIFFCLFNPYCKIFWCLCRCLCPFCD